MVMTDGLPLCCWLCSSQAETNQFTGMVYQGLLLSERKRLSTESIEEHITPNSAPAQWPGNEDSIVKTFLKDTFTTRGWLFINNLVLMLSKIVLMRLKLSWILPECMEMEKMAYV